MLKGIPYWGETTFEDMRTLRAMYNQKSFKEYESESTDLYNLFHELSIKNYVFILPVKDNIYFSWCKDIRFDYRDKLIYIPYYSYMEKWVNSNKTHKHLDTKQNQVNVHYAFQQKLYPVCVPSLNFKITEIYVADVEALIIYNITVPNVYLSEDLSIERLYGAYLNASYFDEEWEVIDFKNNYHWISNEGNLNIEYQIRSANHMPVWKLGDRRESTDMCRKLLHCCDIRLYDLQTIKTLFDFELNTEIQYWERRYLFDAYLLCGILSGKRWLEPQFNKQWEKLGTKFEFIKYGNAEFPLYLKHYYKIDDKITRKSYEKYVRLTDMSVFEE